MDIALFIFNEFCISCQLKLFQDAQNVLDRIAVGKELDERKWGRVVSLNYLLLDTSTLCNCKVYLK